LLSVEKIFETLFFCNQRLITSIHVTIHCHCFMTLLPSTLYWHPDACCHCCRDCCHWQCCWLVSLSLCDCCCHRHCHPCHCHCCHRHCHPIAIISNFISASWLLFKYSILASLSPLVWQVLKRFLKLFLRSKITSIDDFLKTSTNINCIFQHQDSLSFLCTSYEQVGMACKCVNNFCQLIGSYF